MMNDECKMGCRLRGDLALRQGNQQIMGADVDDERAFIKIRKTITSPCHS